MSMQYDEALQNRREYSKPREQGPRAGGVSRHKRVSSQTAAEGPQFKWAKAADEFEAARLLMAAYETVERAKIPSVVSARMRRAQEAVLRISAVDLRGVALKVRMFAMMLEGIDVTCSEELSDGLAAGGVGQILCEFYQQLISLGSLRASQVEVMDWFTVCLRSEGLAKKCADEEWTQYALNPHGLLELVRTLASFQDDVRTLAHAAAPGTNGAAIDAVYYGRFPWDRMAPTGPH